MVQPLICGTRVCDFVFKVGVTNLSEEKKKIKAFQKNLLNYLASRLTEQHRQMPIESRDNYCI